MNEAKIRTRFAPSPTGHLHIGSLRTAVYAYALAKHSGGDFILRIEDTDTKREVEGARKEIEEILKTFGLDWDEKYVQSERAKTGFYQKAAENLVKKGFAFYCNCRSKNAKTEGFSSQLRDPCRDKKLSEGAIKLRVPEGETIKFTDFVLNKEVSWDTSTVSEATLLKSDGFPTYHLAVVVDDHEMGISHVLRGHDWMPSTPIHLLVYKYLEYKLPDIGHLTDIMDPSGGKLSKRKGSVSVKGLMEEGYFPEALLNFVILLGWAPKGNQELFTLGGFIKEFDPGGFQKANPIFNKNKLDWFNAEFIRNLKAEKLKVKIYEFFKGKYSEDKIGEIIPLVQTRIKTLKEFEVLAGFFFKKPKLGKDQKHGLNKKHLKKAVEVIDDINNWSKENLDSALLEQIDKNGFKTGDFFMDLRIAITGSRQTPPINESLIILGKEETLQRLKDFV